MDSNRLFMKALGSSVREYVQKADSQLRSWVSGELKALSELIEERIKQIPEPRHGKDGERGERGDKGDTGERGLSVIGPIGIEGERGQAGEKGEKGDPGESIIGPRGPAGKDADPVDMGELYTKIHEMIDAHLRGLPAPKDGKDGIAGKDGESIHPDTIRLMVIDQIGEVISRIPKPADGRDALQIDIIEAEEGKLYSRGTFATWQGGLVRFTGKDWQTIVRGIHTVDVIRSEDLRTFTVRVGLTDGAIIEKEFAMPVLLDRGVYRANEEYVAGDTVSHQGSGWVCVVDKTSASPSTPNQRDWRLQIKAGRDGRDVKPTSSFDPVVRLK